MKKHLLFLRHPRIVFFLIAIFSFSYFLSSSFLIPKNNIKLSASTPEEHEILSKIFGPSAQATDVYVSTRVYGDFQTYGIAYSDNYWCDSGATRTYYSNQQGSSTNSAVWYGCYAPTSSLGGKYVQTPLYTSGANSFWCEAGSSAKSYFYDTGNDWATVWYACHSDTPISAVVTPPPPTFSPQPSCTGTSISANFSSAGASWYAVRLADLTSGSLISNGICDPASNSNETCQWQTGTSLNRTGIAGHTYRMWVHGATNTSWSAGTYSAAAYATDFSCPAPVVTPPPPTFSPQPSCTGTSISANFSSAGASWYAVRLADLTSGSLISNGICDPASNSNETCQWQTGTSLNRTGIAGHTYRMWVHGATNTSWSAGTYSAAAYATDFSCPSASSAVNGFCGTANGGTTSSAPTSGLCSSGTANPSTPSLSGSTYSWQCRGSGGGSDANCSSNYSSGVSAVPAPTLTFSASPTSFSTGGGNTTLSWSTTNASSCVASGGWSGSKSTANGFTATSLQTVSGTTTFTLQCWNSDNSASVTRSATVTVTSSGPACSGTDNAPYNMTAYRGSNGTYQFKLTGASGSSGGWGTGMYTDDSYLSLMAVHAGIVTPGQSAVVNVTVSGGLSSYTGSTQHGVTTSSYGFWGGTYSLSLVQSCGVPLPPAVTLNFTATPNPTLADKKTLLSWTTTGTVCTGSASPQDVGNIWNGNIAPLGISQQVTLSGDTTFTLVCSDGPSTRTETVFVTIPSLGPSTASTTATVGCTPTASCSADPRTATTCIGSTFTIADNGCGQPINNCPGTKSCGDSNWREVAP